MGIQDENGQSAIKAFHARRLRGRDQDELIGLIQGVIADGVVNQAEAEVMQRWIAANQDLLAEWPANVLSDRLAICLEDGNLDKDEARELFELLEKTVGGTKRLPSGDRPTSTLPLNDPQPPVIFEEKSFCLTGKFAFGPRNKCFEEIRDLGGTIHKNVRLDTDFLVLGTACNEQWKHSTHGNKIAKALEYRDKKGCSLAIIHEDHWAEYVMEPYWD